jgi:hypothetical protein
MSSSETNLRKELEFCTALQMTAALSQMELSGSAAEQPAMMEDVWMFEEVLGGTLGRNAGTAAGGEPALAGIGGLGRSSQVLPHRKASLCSNRSSYRRSSWLQHVYVTCSATAVLEYCCRQQLTSVAMQL